ncbi:hypothetical protein BDQ12DRAFT_607492 [Crucibulum laeve]|uniref:Elongator complex protein 5 n=1 Tax=Crucibulum laeve TaxID=68775 RepID=A0A5C3LXX7_9AGAR|nr:hypothetical protein BDQ12DRAFT_607492 [Crucibulum laeve]
MLSPFNLPEGIVLLITDELNSPADFLLHRSFAEHVKSAKGAKNIVLSVSDSIARWKSIALKSNLNLAQYLASGSLEFVDVSSHIQVPTGRSDQPNLHSLFNIIQPLLEKSDHGLALVILDDISTLEWIGFSLLDITRFTRALRAACLQIGATLIIRHHIVTPGEPDDMFRYLLQICTYRLEVQPLSSGRSGTVSGEIALHSGPGTIVDGQKLIPRSLALQYKLTDNGPTFFEKGTSSGVL